MQQDFVRSTCCGKLFFSYASNLINSVNKNKGSMEDKMLIDMKKTPDENLRLTKKFEDKVDKALEAWMKKNPSKHRE